MATGKRSSRPGSRAARSGTARTDPSVERFLSALRHPRKAELEAVRRLILDASPEIREEVKWNAPSFRTTEFFATANLRPGQGVTLILHRGAKVKDDSTEGMAIPDPTGLLTWLAKERCLVRFADARDVQARGPALQAVVREWIRRM